MSSMVPALSKLILSVSAAGVGCAVVPAAHIVQKHLPPRRSAFHQAAKAPSGDVAAVSSECLSSVSSGPQAQRDGAAVNTLALFAFVIASSAILDLGDALARSRDYLKDFLDDRGIAVMRNS